MGKGHAASTPRRGCNETPGPLQSVAFTPPKRKACELADTPRPAKRIKGEKEPKQKHQKDLLDESASNPQLATCERTTPFKRNDKHTTVKKPRTEQRKSHIPGLVERKVAKSTGSAIIKRLPGDDHDGLGNADASGKAVPTQSRKERKGPGSGPSEWCKLKTMIDETVSSGPSEWCKLKRKIDETVSSGPSMWCKLKRKIDETVDKVTMTSSEPFETEDDGTKKALHIQKCQKNGPGKEAMTCSDEAVCKLPEDRLLRKGEDTEGLGHYRRMVQAGKSPGDFGCPKVWCQSRQELCEGYALDKRFIQYQSGFQFRKLPLDDPVNPNARIATAILLAGSIAPRDIFKRRVFITHGGGKNACDKERKRANVCMSLATSQEETDHNIESLINAMKGGHSVMVIVSQDYFLKEVLPDGLTYAVLGYYRITHIWREKEGQNVRIKLRYELVPDQASNVWHVKAKKLRDSKRTTGSLDYCCPTCKEVSPKVYTEQVCLRHQCEAFWKAVSGVDVAEGMDLRHNRDFLRPMLSMKSTCTPPSVVPLQPSPSQQARTSACEWCNRCGRLSRRIFSNKWVCETCENEVSFTLPVLPLSAAIRLPVDKKERFNCFQVLPGSNIKGYLVAIPPEPACRMSGWFKVVYTLPEGGEIHHMLAPKDGHADVDKLYKELQEGDLEYQRMPVKSRIGKLVTSNFVLNSGEKYYQASVLPSRPMEANTKVEKAAIAMLQDAAKEFGTKYNQSHKNLTLADDVKWMKWHDDGEKTVFGPVSALSMGSDCIFSFRTKPTCRDTAPNGVGPGRQVLKLRLRHGDILIMVGKKVQANYEHCAKPQGHRISVTARTVINPDTIMPKTQRRALDKLEAIYKSPTESVPKGVLIFDGREKVKGKNATSTETLSVSPPTVDMIPLTDDSLAMQLARQLAGCQDTPPPKETHMSYDQVKTEHITGDSNSTRETIEIERTDISITVNATKRPAVARGPGGTPQRKKYKVASPSSISRNSMDKLKTTHCRYPTAGCKKVVETEADEWVRVDG
ncbi:uncharacterized protein EV422DRAFT_532755 [Fimicolochytrium jonesii]|uniref:uncharacterized protein n=1 Tax=Fimicolochytrium jonesii TaxID=1396493 RepID=UPI0022FDD8AA|nr:uncharacterized protein EV422DRAFT_532755 [Fimicolochytrium jonesii]KAI8819916.1 hypothetical protein EV422DRAFT_532755 [Fimicolochytrium jonesii]